MDFDVLGLCFVLTKFYGRNGTSIIVSAMLRSGDESKNAVSYTCLPICLFVYRHGLIEPSLALSFLCKPDDAEPKVLMLLPPLPASGIIGV